VKKTQINKCLYNVVTPEDYRQNQSVYNPRFTAIECRDGSKVLPINSRATDTTPGVYFYPGNGMVGTIIKPETNLHEYEVDNVIDYTKAKDIEDIIRNNEMLRDIQNDIITTSDNILKLNISDNDTPEMRALKIAINSKGVDKKQYEDRFDQFQNDMRLLKGNSITLGKLISICTAFDIAAELTLKDKENVPNPIGDEIVVDLTIEREAK
jgi:hypothetical protein